MNKILITILTCHRPRYLSKTLKALKGYAYDPTLCRTRIFINGDDPDTRNVVNQYPDLFDKVLSSPENLGQAPALNQLWSETEADFILHIEDDMVVTRAGWLKPALEFFARYPRIGQLRLYPFWEIHHISRHNLITKKPIEFHSPEPIGEEKFSRMIEPAHFAFIPSLFRVSALSSFLPLSADRERDQAENQAQRGFRKAGWDTAQIHNGPFRHIGRRSVFGGWGVGFGLHPTTRAGGFRLKIHRKAVKLAKRILGRD
ncbi:MAG: glycosyltransferase [Candidatus Auribacterota bacterium]|nr:glycosyltransferase [Candidatus Auribacterota bacterium]